MTNLPPTPLNPSAFKAKGTWDFEFNMGQNGNFSGGGNQTGWGRKSMDEFDAIQRIRIQLDAVASEALSGTFGIEVGTTSWGKYGSSANRGGAALGGDQTEVIKVRHAYLDWMPPQSDLKIRMGLQPLGLPSFTTGSQVFNDDVAGISMNYKFNDNVSLTALWARPYNDNFGGDTVRYGGNGRASYMDNVDAFALVLPLTFDGVKVTPWAMYASIGPNAFRDGTAPNSAKSATAWTDTRAGMFPAYYGHKYTNNIKNLTRYGDAFWFGLTGEVTAFDPFRVAWDFNYGTAAYGESLYNRHGWMASLLFEYKLDWGIPGLYGWYASGDDNDPSNGSERMPFVGNNSTQHGFSTFAFNGNPWMGDREGIIGKNQAGTWGIGARLKDFSFVEDLKHTLRLNYIGGTNLLPRTKWRGGLQSAIAAPNAAGNNINLGRENLYMTTGDSALEIGLTNNYQMYENFLVYVDAAYLATWLDHSRKVWGNTRMNSRSDQVRDPWNVNIGFVYNF